MVRRTVLAGRYELASPLGRGGMGQVWEADDQRLGRRVAVKLLTDDVLAGRSHPQELARRFAREAAVTAGLQHPGVPAVYDAGSYDGGLFLVMELVAGVTLGDLMAEQGPFPVAWAAGIAAQVAAVLAAAHARRLVHRDVKPQNVMLTGDGTVKVLDFGVAAALDQAVLTRLTRTGDAVGTPAYMAPEQLRSGPATPRTDLYALGCVLYEMLAGEPVFDATSPAALMHKHLEQAPAPLTRPDLPAGLGALVRALLEKDPARRPADARETYDRLLSHVAVSGRLGEVDPAAREHSSGMHLYARVLTRLSGAASPPRPDPRPSPAEAAAHWPGRPLPQPTVGTSGSAGPAAAYGHPQGDGVYDGPWASVDAGRYGGPPAGDGPYGAAGGSAHAPGQANGGAGGPYAQPRGGAAGGPPPGGQNPGWGASFGSGGANPAGHPGSTAGRGDRPGTVPGVGRKLVHSLWMVPTLLFGLCTWLSFGYIAARNRRSSWLVSSVVYLVVEVVAFALAGSGPDEDTFQSDIGMIMGLILWPVGIVHALWADNTVRQLRRDREARREAAGGALLGSRALW